MATQINSADGFPSDLLVDLDGGNRRELRRRLEDALRGAIQSGRLVPGAALPPTRTLAAELAVSRSVVVGAYGNLKADGYLEARTGAGTRVRAEPLDPRRSLGFRRGGQLPPDRGRPAIRLSGRLPDPALFPRTQWLRHYRAALAAVPDPELTYPNMLGTPSLRAALTAYLGRVRGIVTTADRILICSGFTQGLTLVCRALRRRGVCRVAVEDPCFAHHRDAITMTGLEPVPVAVDGRGLDPDRLQSDVTAALVSPAHSYPTGRTLDPDRRRALIAWARATEAVVIEDDFHAEFRYDGQPIGALQAQAPERVVYIGCASKSLSPALRLGWLAAPADLIDGLEREKLYEDMGSNLLDQLAFARFVDSGDFSRYLRRVRPVYRRRRDATIGALAELLPEARWDGGAAGLHLHVMLPDDVDEQRFIASAHAKGVLVEDAARHWARPDRAPPSIVLGYGSASEAVIRRGVAILGHALGACR